LMDLKEVAGFLAAQVLLASYDGILTTGQNFYMYIDPRSKKIGFIPWDLDCAWGNFWIGSKSQLERASIWRPWSGENRFLERLFAVKEFRAIYRARLEEMLERDFTAERMQRRVDEIAGVIREPIGAESRFRLEKFEQEVGTKPVTHAPGETESGVNQPAYPYRKFVETRARSVRLQLDGKSKGLIVPRLAERFIRQD
jgi:spore coat protein H